MSNNKPIIICHSVNDAAKLCSSLFGMGNNNANGKGQQHGPKRLKNNNWPRDRKGSQPRHHQHTFSRENETRKSQQPTRLAPIVNNLLFLGDSIALRMARELGGHAPKNMLLCQGGMTFSSFAEALEQCGDLPAKNVCILLGMNNVLKNQTIDANDLKTLVEKLQNKGAAKLIICTIPPISGNQNIKHKWGIQSINSFIKSINSPDIHIVDTYKLFVNDKGEIDKTDFETFHLHDQKDLIHPNSTGLRLMAREIFSAFNKMSIEVN